MKKNLVLGAVGKLRPAGKNVAWATGGAIMVLVATVAAQQGVGGKTEEDCALKDAASQAVNNKIKMIGMTTPDPSKYFTPGGPDSCLGGITDIDLSVLIPDPYGVLSAAAMKAIDAIAKAAMNKVCTAARSSFGGTIDQYNNAARTVGGMGGSGGIIDSTIGKEVDKSLGDYGVNYGSGNASAGAGTVKSVQDVIQVPTNQGAQQKSGSANLLTQNGANAATLTSAAGNVESARLNMVREQQAAAAAADEVQKAAAAERVRSAEAAYSNAQNRYKEAESKVNSYGGGQASPAAPATIGTSVF